MSDQLTKAAEAIYSDSGIFYFENITNNANK